MNDILDAVRLLKNWQQQQWQALAKLCRIMWLRVKGLNVICSQEIGQSPAAWESSSGHCWNGHIPDVLGEHENIWSFINFDACL